MLKIYLTSAFFFLFVFTTYSKTARLVQDITPGSSGSFSFDFFPEDDGIQLTFDDKILFVIETGGDYNLWVTDGQEENTVALLENVGQFYDFMDGQDGNIYFSHQVTNSEYRLYALDQSNLNLTVLYTSEGVFKALAMLNGKVYAAAGNNLVAITPETQTSEVIKEFSFFYTIHDLHTLGNQLIIAGGDDDENGLLVSDGTASGTQAYYQFNGVQNYNGDYFMTIVDDEVFFFANSAEYSYALYRTNGTAEGTQLIQEFQRINFHDMEARRSIIAWNDKLYFRAKRPDSSSGQQELFVSDGSPEGTYSLEVSEFNDSPRPSDFTVYNDELYFVADEAGSSIYTVYKTDGTQEGTVKAIDRNALGTGLSLGGFFLTAHQDSLYFTGYRSAVGEELWVSGGTTESTHFVDLVPGSTSSSPSQLMSTGDQLFFTYRSPEYGKEVFVLEEAIVSAITTIVPEQMKVFPNPIYDELTLQLPTAQAYNTIDVEVIDPLGKVVCHILSTSEKIDLASLSSGIYIVKARVANSIYTAKILKH